MNGPRTKTLSPDATGIAEAASLLAGGRLVAFPTETVYGLGADASNGEAVARIFEAKGRPRFNPLIAHVSGADVVETICQMSPMAHRLADAFWPGPLTLVLPMRAGAQVSGLATAGLQTLAVRVPAHPVARALLAAFGGPVAAPSANPSGKVSPTRAAHVLAGLEGRIDAVVDGGACAVGVESTIVACGPDGVMLLREGGVSREALASVLGEPPLVQPSINLGAPTSPGQLASHYAPVGSVRLDATSAEEGEVMLGFGEVSGALNLSPTGDLAEAAASLFDCLHRLDAMGAARIAVAPIPEHGLGAAINDRLRRAAAPRET